MIQFENEYRHESPLSPEMVQGFIRACNNLAPYGEHARSNDPSFRKLSFEDGELKVTQLTNPKMGATHIDSGTITAPGHGYADGKATTATIWTPLEAALPAKTKILGKERQLTTVSRSVFYDYQLGLTPQDIIATSTGRIFSVIKWGDVNDPNGPGPIPEAEELTQDWQVEDVVGSLTYMKKVIETKQ